MLNESWPHFLNVCALIKHVWGVHVERWWPWWKSENSWKKTEICKRWMKSFCWAKKRFFVFCLCFLLIYKVEGDSLKHGLHNIHSTLWKKICLRNLKHTKIIIKWIHKSTVRHIFVFCFYFLDWIVGSMNTWIIINNNDIIIMIIITSSSFCPL